jgi:alpha-beta hydrolase superfamily lysophospholipase
VLVEEKLLTLGREGKVKLFITRPEDLDNIKGVVSLNHGMGEHIERYKYFSEKLANAGYIVYGHNHRGHKDSIETTEDYGYIDFEDSFEILVDDNLRIVEMIKKEYPNLPIFLFGHSMGSFIVQRFAQLHGKKINGIILSGSAKHNKFALRGGLMLAKTICKFKGAKYRSKTLFKLTFGAFNKPFKPARTEYDWLNRDEIEVDKYINDEYCGGIFSASFYRDFFKGLRTLNHNYELVPKDLPILILSGEKDPVGGNKKLVEKLYYVYQKNSIKYLEMKLYPDARHEILLELNKEEVIQDCIEWIDRYSKLYNI